VSKIEVHIPVTKFAIGFELGESRPYSVFEQLLLEAVHEGATTTASLADAMSVPTRLVIEGVVTLVQAGWVGIQADDGSLRCTPAGADSIASGASPSTLVVHRPHPLHVVMERHTGATCHSANVMLHRTRFLTVDRADEVHRLPARVHDNQLEPSRSRHHIAVRPGQWIRWVDPDPQIISKNGHVAIGVYDTDTGRLLNLPEEFRAALEPLLVERFGRVAGAAAAQAPAVPTSAQFAVSASDVELVVNDAEHQRLLAHALATAETRVAICTAFVNARCVEATAPAIGEALERGVAIDLLWGYGSEATADAIDRLKKLAYDHRQSKGSLRFNVDPTNSHAKILMWKTADGWHTSIGSYNWMSARGTSAGEASLRVTSLSLASHVSHFISDIAQSLPGGRTDVVAKAWSRVADDLSASSSAASSSPDLGGLLDGELKAELVFGRSHDSLLRRAIVDPDPGNMVVLSGGVTGDGIERLVAGSTLARRDYPGLMSAGEILDDSDVATIRDAVESIGGKWRSSKVHAKVLLHGDAVTVGSYNYLSTDPDGRSARGRELSLRLEGRSARQALTARLAELLRGSVE